MKIVSFSFLALLAASTPCAAQTNQPALADPDPSLVLEPEATPRLNKVGLSYRMGLNIKVDFSRLGGLQLSDPGPASGAAINRRYDNGYSFVDISGNNGGYTWYWGYQSPNSAQPGSLALQSDSTPATAESGTYQDGPQSGLELTYSRELKRGKHWRLGVEGGLGYTAISITDRQTLSHYAVRTSDTFDTGAVVLPLPPYNGTFEGPGPLISSTLAPGDRTVTVLPGAATIIGRRKIECDLFTLRLGPYLEVPLSRKFSVNLLGGLTLAVADSTIKYRETVLISDPFYGINLAGPQRSASANDTDFLVGAYAGANLAYALSDRVDVFAGAIFQTAGRSLNTETGKRSVLDLGNSVLISIGATYAF